MGNTNMQVVHKLKILGLRACTLLALTLFLSACGGGGGGAEAGSDISSASDAAVQEGTPGTQTSPEADKAPLQVVTPGAGSSNEGDGTGEPGAVEEPEDGLDDSSPADAEESVPAEDAEEESVTAEPTPPLASEAARFLSQATFGPTTSAIDELQSQGYENWLLTEFDKPATLHLHRVLSVFPQGGAFLDSDGQLLPGLKNLASNSFWETSIEADDQLRQRMAFALSQILVFSDQTDFRKAPQMKARYMDILTQGAFGNYRDLLEQVTYSTAMGNYLTYLRSRKGDPATGRQPDENYARELLQLFTVGLVELQQDGSPRLDSQGREIAVYNNSDIRELAKVFTGLSYRDTAFYTPFKSVPPASVYSAMAMFEEYNSKESKNVFGTQIPADIDGEQGIDMALDAIFAHANVGPFVSRQLIQRFVTSTPTADYTQRVAGAFDSGSYTLPSGDSVGTGQRGDLRAVLAAILLDEEARGASARERQTFGKLREPVLRFTHWARAFQVNDADPSNVDKLQASGADVRLAQHPFRASSVFNFYRPGYMAPGSATAAAGLNAPEMEITNATSIVGYASFITAFIFETFIRLDPDLPDTYQADYSYQANLASDINTLLDELDLLLTHGTLREDTRGRITQFLSTRPVTTAEERRHRVQLATLMIMTSPEYLVLR